MLVKLSSAIGARCILVATTSPPLPEQVAARSRQLLIEYRSPSVEERRLEFAKAVSSAADAEAAGDDAARQAVMEAFVSQYTVVFLFH